MNLYRTTQAIVQYEKLCVIHLQQIEAEAKDKKAQTSVVPTPVASNCLLEKIFSLFRLCSPNRNEQAARKEDIDLRT